MLRLDQLPFKCSFDIMFLHGGMNEFQRIFNGKGCFGLYTIFGDTQWTRAISICCAVESLDHPAHALFLLNYPYHPSIPESKRAWDAAWRCCLGPDPDPEMLVWAMRIFSPMHRNTVFPWLRVDEHIMAPRMSVDEWRALGRKQASNYMFNRWWWHDQVEMPLLENLRGMEKVIPVLAAQEEMPRLRNALARDVGNAVRERKKCEMWKIAYREAIHAGRPRPKSIGVVKFTKKDQSDIEAGIDVRLKAHEDMVVRIKKALPGLLRRFPADYVARAVSAVGRANPRMKWTLRLLFHRASGLRAFDAERMLETWCEDDGFGCVEGALRVFGH